MTARMMKFVALKAACAIALGLAVASCDSDAIAADPDAPVYTASRIVFPSARSLALPEGVEAGSPLRSLLNVPGPMRYGEFVWADEGVPPGKVWVLVDLAAQTMSVFRGGHELGTAITLYGVDSKETPLGRFRVLAMIKDHQSSIYDAAMPYTLRLTGDGIAIHGSDVRAGIGTHGCLGIPLDFASKLFDEAEVGTEVVIVRRSGAEAVGSPAPSVS